jgi:hypothetical protein
MKGFTKQIAKRSTIADFNRFNRSLRRGPFVPEMHYHSLDNLRTHMTQNDACARYHSNVADTFNNFTNRKNPEFD